MPDQAVSAVHDPVHIGAPARRFICRTTMGERALEDYRGRWLVFFSHPADFTPVCTSEFIAFAQAHEEFQALGCDLLALSVDSLFAHVAWIKAIRDAFNIEIPFPLAEDPSMAIATAYGMLPPNARDSTTVRSNFIIDPDGIIRALSVYPMSTGRNVAEILRTVRALQTTDMHNVFTPEAWQAGGHVIKPASPISGTGSLDSAWFYKTCELEAQR